MPNDKPLPVRVAERMGWRDVQTLGKRESGKHAGPDVWVGRRPGAFDIEGFDFVPPYGENSWQGWACTGPLLLRAVIFELIACIGDTFCARFERDDDGSVDEVVAPSATEAIAQAYLRAKAAH